MGKLSPANPEHYAAHHEVLEALAARVFDRFTGRRHPMLVGPLPKNMFSVGLLSPEYQTKGPDDVSTSFAETFSPSMVGYDFYVSKKDVERGALRISIAGALYAPVVPSFQQAAASNKLSVPDRDSAQPSDSDVEELEDESEEAAASEFVLPYVSKRYEFALGAPIVIPLRDVSAKGYLEQDVGAPQIQEITTAMRKDPSCLRAPQGGAGRIKLAATPKDESGYAALVNDKLTDRPFVIQPRLRLQVMVGPVPTASDLALVRVKLVNDGARPKGRLQRFGEPHFFDTQLRTVLVDCESAPTTSVLVTARDYRYDPRDYCVGINAACRRTSDASTTSFELDHMPSHTQPIYGPRVPTDPKARPAFSNLIEKPIATLRSIEGEMRDYLQREWDDRSFDRYRLAQQLPSTAQFEDYKAARRRFETEVARFSAGIDTIERHEDVLTAFVLMNRTMRASAADPSTGVLRFDAWRLFQIVYIVCVVADLAAREHPVRPDARDSKGIGEQHPNTREAVDVLWFPTGGGKTETYLGVIMWNAWWDRLRGKSFGVTAWAKFPLRFLSLQQQSRFLRTIIEANVLMADATIAQKLPKQAEPFSLGYYVGGRNTPNRWMVQDFYGTEEESVLRIVETDPERRRDWNVVPICPRCGKETTLEPDKKNMRLYIVCEKDGRLPVYIIDEEIYRYAPTILLGTLDKMAVMGHNRRFRRIFLGETHRCPIHGYTTVPPSHAGPKCQTGKGVTCDRAAATPPLHDPGPTLLLQDELHLLEASLGGFEAHYESFIDHFQAKLLPEVIGRVVPGSVTLGSWKILAATATISGYQDQVRKLYLRDAVRFPHPGPTRGGSFYAETKNEPRRTLVAFRPNNMSTPVALTELLAETRAFVAELIADPQKAAHISKTAKRFSEAELLELVDHVSLSLSYHLSRREATATSFWYGSQLTERIKREVPGLGAGFEPRCVELTGDTPFYEVVEVARQLEGGEDLRHSHIAHIAATKMVSHGVDIGRLNVMVFEGMPRSHSEYIQSHSRAGRTWPGVVFDLINTKRTRDLSHYVYHAAYHERVDLLIEPVALTRWGSNTYVKTIPGLIAALIHMYYSPRRSPLPLYKPQHLKDALQGGAGPAGIAKDEVGSILVTALGCDVDPEGELYRKDVPAFVEKVLQTVSNNVHEATFFGAFEKYRPMMSMRDIEPTVELHHNGTTLAFYENLKKSRGGVRLQAPEENELDAEAEDDE